MDDELKIDRAVYLVDEATKTYRYVRRNLSWSDLDPKENERNKRHLDGYTRVFPDGRRTMFRYRPPYTTSAAPGRAAGPEDLDMATLRRTVDAFLSIVRGLPAARRSGAHWGPHEVLSHLAFWHEHYVRLVAEQLAGREPQLPEGTFNELNALAVAKFRDSSTETVARRLLAAQTRLERLAADPAVARIQVRIKAGSKAWPWFDFLRRLEAHIRQHAADLRRASRFHLAAGAASSRPAPQTPSGDQPKPTVWV